MVAPQHKSANAECIKVYDENAEVYDEDMTVGSWLLQSKVVFSIALCNPVLTSIILELLT